MSNHVPVGHRRCYGGDGPCREDVGHGPGVLPEDHFSPKNKRCRVCTRRYQRERAKDPERRKKEIARHRKRRAQKKRKKTGKTKK